MCLNKISKNNNNKTRSDCHLVPVWLPHETKSDDAQILLNTYSRDGIISSFMLWAHFCQQLQHLFIFYFQLERKNLWALSASVYNSLVTIFQVRLDVALIFCVSLMAGVKACLQAGKWLPEAEYEAGEGPQHSRINKCSLVSYKHTDVNE